MKAGFIGAGRVGTSMGGYLSEKGIQISGYSAGKSESRVLLFPIMFITLLILYAKKVKEVSTLTESRS